MIYLNSHENINSLSAYLGIQFYFKDLRVDLKFRIVNMFANGNSYNVVYIFLISDITTFDKYTNNINWSFSKIYNHLFVTISYSLYGNSYI